MPQLTGPLLADGALIEVRIGLDRAEIQKLRFALRPVPQPKHLRALVDSGAEATCLDSTLIQSLGLAWSGPTQANVPAISGLVFASLYRAGITILHGSGQSAMNFDVGDIAVCELALGSLGYDALIGRDILDQLRFTYDGPARTFALEWK